MKGANWPSICGVRPSVTHGLQDVTDCRLPPISTFTPFAPGSGTFGVAAGTAALAGLAWPFAATT